VLDEAHKAPDELAAFLHTTLTKLEIEGILGSRALTTDDPTEWADWALDETRLFKQGIEDMEEDLSHQYDARLAKEYQVNKRLYRKLQIVSKITDDWIVERNKHVTFDPIWPKSSMETLFQNVPKVILLSATIRPKTCELLGIDRKDLTFYEGESSFPVERRPFIKVPCVRVDNKTTDDELATWVVKIDNIIEKRKGRRGLIHTVSYARRDYIRKHSRHSKRMIWHDPRDTAFTIDSFKRGDYDGTILISPSATCGYDFPYNQCRFIIICKVPFPDARSKILKARCKQDKDYAMYLAMQELVQGSGRGMRAPDDWCEILCVDDNFNWYYRKYSRFAPKWFGDSIRYVKLAPDPLEVE